MHFTCHNSHCDKSSKFPVLLRSAKNNSAFARKGPQSTHLKLWYILTYTEYSSILLICTNTVNQTLFATTFCNLPEINYSSRRLFYAIRPTCMYTHIFLFAMRNIRVDEAHENSHANEGWFTVISISLGGGVLIPNSKCLPDHF